MSLAFPKEKNVDLDEILAVENFSDRTVQILSDRLQRSCTEEHCIYREIELDELWRLLDIAAEDGAHDVERLRHMRDIVHRAHDLVGMDGKPQEAARILREARL